MPLRNPKPISWRPTGCSDAQDGSEAFEGAMSLLQDLVPSDITNRNWVCRPAATAIAAISAGNPISATFVAGDVLYGFVSDGAGHDLPFAYNLATGSPLPVTFSNPGTGITTQPTTGDWTPPTFAQVGARIVATHPGFNNNIFMTGNAATWVAVATLGSTTLVGGLTLADMGDSIFGPSIAPGATIAARSINGTIGQAGGTAAGSAGNNTITITPGAIVGLPPGAGMAIQNGIGVTGTVLSYNAGTGVITYSGQNPSTFSSTGLHWTGATIVMSLPAIATSPATGETVNSASTFPDPSGASRKFGIFDISSASIQLPATLSPGSQTISLANAFGLQPGMAVSGPGIPPSTFLRTLRSQSISKNGTPPNAGDLVLILVGTDLGGNLPLPGQVISGPGITSGTQVAGQPTITGYSLGNYTVSVPLSFPAAGGAAGVASAAYLFGGLIVGFINNPPTLSGVQTLTFTGGIPATPIFSIVDTAYNPLPSQPVGVTVTPWGAAIFACGINGMPYSDSLLPAQRTNASQALVAGDGLAITALGGLPLSSPITGGIIQAVIAFAGVSRMYQITGAPVTSNVTLQPMNIATGTASPLSITPTILGLAFASPGGVRVVGFDGRISDPLGDAGTDQGISYVFKSTINPSRIVGASDSHSMRFTVINNTNPAVPTFQEWCFDIPRKRWYGPQSSSYAAMQLWRAMYVGVLIRQNDTLATAPLAPGSHPTYVEFGVPLTYQAKTVLLPDNPNEDAFGVVEASVWVAANPTDPVQFTAFDDQGTVLDIVTLTAAATPRQRLIPQDTQWVFRQMALQIGGTSDAAVVIGRINLRYQELGYPLPAP